MNMLPNLSVYLSTPALIGVSSMASPAAAAQQDSTERQGLDIAIPGRDVAMVTSCIPWSGVSSPAAAAQQDSKESQGLEVDVLGREVAMVTSCIPWSGIAAQLSLS